MKRLTISVVFALMAMAALSATSASAGTVLCKVTGESSCFPQYVAPKGEALKTSGSKFVLEGTKPLLSCSKNEMNMKTTMKNGNPLPGELNGVLLPSNCVAWGQATSTCSSTAINNAPISFLNPEYGGGGVVRIGDSKTSLEVSFTCTLEGVGHSCTYRAWTGNVEVPVSSWGGNANIKGLSMNRQGSDTACGPTSAKLTVENTAATGVVIHKATETVICKKKRQDVSPCPNAEVLSAGNGFGAQVSKLELMEPEYHEVSMLTCNSGTLLFGTTDEAGTPLPGTSENHINAAPCTAWNDPDCTSVNLNNPPVAAESTGKTTGTVSMGTAAQPLTVEYICEMVWGVQTCKYAASGSVSLQVNGSGEASVKGAPMTRAKVGYYDIFCPEAAELEIQAVFDPSGYALNIV